MIKEYQLGKLQNSYEVTLYYKGVKVRVAFTGGNVYNGTLPKFRTDNLFKMKAIEASELFKNKEVVLLRTIGKPEVQKSFKSQIKKSNIGKPVMPKSAVVALEPKPAPAPEPETPEPEPEKETPTDPMNPEPAPVEAVEEEGPKEIVYDNLGEAISYIAQNFQMEVRTEKEARDVLKAHGIKPVIKKG